MKISQITYSRRGVVNYNDSEVVEVTIVNPENPETELAEVKEWVNNHMADRHSLADLECKINNARHKYYQLRQEVKKAEILYEASQEFLIAQGLKTASDCNRFPYSLPALPESVEAEIDDDGIPL